MVRHLVELKARLTWNGVRHDVQRRFGFPVATILLSWLALWLAGKHTTILESLSGNQAATDQYLGWVALFMFLAWITLPVIIFPLDENLDPQQLAVLPVSRTQIVKGLTAASFVAPATVVPLILLSANLAGLASAWWMAIPASLVYLAMLSVGAQLFSAAISAILRTRRGRDIATFLILGLAAGSFFVYRTVSETVSLPSHPSAMLGTKRNSSKKGSPNTPPENVALPMRRSNAARSPPCVLRTILGAMYGLIARTGKLTKTANRSAARMRPIWISSRNGPAKAKEPAWTRKVDNAIIVKSN